MIERQTQKMTADERHKYRLEHSRPVLTAFLAWLKYHAPKATPKGPLGKAITYCLNQWDKLTAFLKDGRLELDNNRAERSIKPFVIGRKNFLFSNTPRGARSSAIVYSIVESAKENNLNPRAFPLAPIYSILARTSSKSRVNKYLHLSYCYKTAGHLRPSRRFFINAYLIPLQILTSGA